MTISLYCLLKSFKRPPEIVNFANGLISISNSSTFSVFSFNILCLVNMLNMLSLISSCETSKQLVILSLVLCKLMGCNLTSITRLKIVSINISFNPLYLSRIVCIFTKIGCTFSKTSLFILSTSI